MIPSKNMLLGKHSSDRIMILFNTSNENAVKKSSYELVIDCNIPGMTDTSTFLTTRFNADEIISGLRLKLRDNSGEAYKFYRNNPLLSELHCILLILEATIE